MMTEETAKTDSGAQALDLPMGLDSVKKVVARQVVSVERLTIPNARKSVECYVRETLGATIARALAIEWEVRGFTSGETCVATAWVITDPEAFAVEIAAKISDAERRTRAALKAEVAAAYERGRSSGWLERDLVGGDA